MAYQLYADDRHIWVLPNLEHEIHLTENARSHSFAFGASTSNKGVQTTDPVNTTTSPSWDVPLIPDNVFESQTFSTEPLPLQNQPFKAIRGKDSFLHHNHMLVIYRPTTGIYVCHRETGEILTDLSSRIENSNQATAAPPIVLPKPSKNAIVTPIEGLVGLLMLARGAHLVYITKATHAATILNRDIFLAEEFSTIPVPPGKAIVDLNYSARLVKEEQLCLHNFLRVLRSTPLYFSRNYELTLTLQKAQELSQSSKNNTSNLDYLTYCSVALERAHEEYFFNRSIYATLCHADVCTTFYHDQKYVKQQQPQQTAQTPSPPTKNMPSSKKASKNKQNSKKEEPQEDKEVVKPSLTMPPQRAPLPGFHHPSAIAPFLSILVAGFAGESLIPMNLIVEQDEPFEKVPRQEVARKLGNPLRQKAKNTPRFRDNKAKTSQKKKLHVETFQGDSETLGVNRKEAGDNVNANTGASTGDNTHHTDESELDVTDLETTDVSMVLSDSDGDEDDDEDDDDILAEGENADDLNRKKYIKYASLSTLLRIERHRYGLRLSSRGIDPLGFCGITACSEVIFQTIDQDGQPQSLGSFASLRGSPPVFFDQIPSVNPFAQPDVVFPEETKAGAYASSLHFSRLISQVISPEIAATALLVAEKDQLAAGHTDNNSSIDKFIKANEQATSRSLPFIRVVSLLNDLVPHERKINESLLQGIINFNTLIKSFSNDKEPTKMSSQILRAIALRQLDSRLAYQILTSSLKEKEKEEEKEKEKEDTSQKQNTSSPSLSSDEKNNYIVENAIMDHDITSPLVVYCPLNLNNMRTAQSTRLLHNYAEDCGYFFVDRVSTIPRVLARQRGFLRVNCFDSLDRTNKVIRRATEHIINLIRIRISDEILLENPQSGKQVSSSIMPDPLLYASYTLLNNTGDVAAFVSTGTRCVFPDVCPVKSKSTIPWEAQVLQSPVSAVLSSGHTSESPENTFDLVDQNMVFINTIPQNVSFADLRPPSSSSSQSLHVSSQTTAPDESRSSKTLSLSVTSRSLSSAPSRSNIAFQSKPQTKRSFGWMLQRQGLAIYTSKVWHLVQRRISDIQQTGVCQDAIALFMTTYKPQRQFLPFQGLHIVEEPIDDANIVSSGPKRPRYILTFLPESVHTLQPFPYVGIFVLCSFLLFLILALLFFVLPWLEIPFAYYLHPLVASWVFGLVPSVSTPLYLQEPISMALKAGLYNAEEFQQYGWVYDCTQTSFWRTFIACVTLVGWTAISLVYYYRRQLINYPKVPANLLTPCFDFDLRKPNKKQQINTTF